MTGYSSLGKQVLQDNAHVADAKDVETAAMIAEALNIVYYPTEDGLRPPEDASPYIYADDVPDATTLEWTPVPLAEGYRITKPGTIIHDTRRENDEYACSCGTRWDVSEGEEHP